MHQLKNNIAMYKVVRVFSYIKIDLKTYNNFKQNMNIERYCNIIVSIYSPKKNNDITKLSK